MKPRFVLLALACAMLAGCEQVTPPGPSTSECVVNCIDTRVDRSMTPTGILFVITNKHLGTNQVIFIPNEGAPAIGDPNAIPKEGAVK